MRRPLIFCISIGFLLHVLFPFCASTVKCWQCSNASSFSECEASGNTTDCADTEVCSTEVRKHYDEIKIWKRCKQKKACENQRLQNWKRTPHKCSNDQYHSHCWCCCDNDSCNLNETCEVVSTKCPMPTLHMDHGHVTCSNANHLGSLCSYKCNETGYHDSPVNKQDRLCLGNGKWSEKKPCCIRECPPYVPLDLISLYQFNSEKSFNTRTAGFGFRCSNLVMSKEYFQGFDIYFNDKIYKIVLPDDVDRLGYYQASLNNTANTGLALRYVQDNILVDSHRTNGHSDVIALVVDKESDDDVTKVAAQLKNNGATINYYFFESKEHKVNMEEARAVASSENHIFVVDGKREINFAKIFNEFFAQACIFPCPNDDEE